MISFIIPAYNASIYLKRVIKSIVENVNNKTFLNNIEILIIENGSTDNTTEVAEEIAKIYSNIRVLHSEKGVSNARNYGIKYAKGEWIAFVDADDYLTKQGIEAILRDANSLECDMYIYGYEAGKNRCSLVPLNKALVYNSSEIEICRVMMLENPTRYMQVWNKLFKKEIILQNKVHFQERMRLSEDSDFTLQYTKYCSRIKFQPEIVYHYSVDNISTMRNTKTDKIKDYVFAMECTSKHIRYESAKIKVAFDKYILMHFNVSMVRDLYSRNDQNFFQKVRKMKQILISNKIFYEALKRTRWKECTSVRMVPILCMKCKCYFMAALIYKLRVIQNKKREK